MPQQNASESCLPPHCRFNSFPQRLGYINTAFLNETDAWNKKIVISWLHAKVFLHGSSPCPKTCLATCSRSLFSNLAVQLCLFNDWIPQAMMSVFEAKLYLVLKGEEGDARVFQFIGFP